MVKSDLDMKKPLVKSDLDMNEKKHSFSGACRYVFRAGSLFTRMIKLIQ
ncbi:hypothetical protein LTSEINV_5017 [Salmonella enterica subsp. enterica serovar Inverness str. R8-3668]|uniref:Uncharacterized protein n=1 Tax=Salmonella enterica subsp. enterica serovar Inverness str. R8-3668 TaxID=913075 RepID=G5NIZ6_SALET|nr:hypothetical protein LTSEINV_5017 [Salmonella enterica subsp. enterica serovar Inverness str. R8-3668]